MRADSLVYPHDELRPDGQSRQHFGLSVRDYIAIQVLPGLNLDAATVERSCEKAYWYADAMIAESQREMV
jgi:hypothetical protein